MITLKDFEDGKLPEKLYHVTPVSNLENIMKLGLVHDLSEDEKSFEWCEQMVYMFPRVDLADAVLDLFYDVIASEFSTLEEITSSVVEKYVILSIDCNGLDKNKVGLDEPFIGKEHEEVLSYTYENTIESKYLQIVTYIEKTYDKEFLQDTWEELFS